MQLTRDNESLSEEKSMLEKKMQIDEESFKKRIKLHEEFIKGQEEKQLENEDRYRKEIEETKLRIEAELTERNFAEQRKIRENLQEEI